MLFLQVHTILITVILDLCSFILYTKIIYCKMMYQFWLVICSHVSGLPFHVFASRKNLEWLTYVIGVHQSCSDVDTMMKLPHTLLLLTYPHSCAALNCTPQWRVDLNGRVSRDTRTTAIPFYNLGLASIVGLGVSGVQEEREKQVIWWRSFFLSLRHVRLFSAAFGCS